MKIGNVVSDVFGVSGQEIVSALLKGTPVSAIQDCPRQKREVGIGLALARQPARAAVQHALGLSVYYSSFRLPWPGVSV